MFDILYQCSYASGCILSGHLMFSVESRDCAVHAVSVSLFFFFLVDEKGQIVLTAFIDSTLGTLLSTC